MKRTLSLSLLSLLFSSANATHIQPEVDRIINQVDPAIHIGMKVVDLNTGEVLYQRNATEVQ